MMAWPGDAGSSPSSPGGFSLGFLFEVGPELIPLMPSIKAAIETLERYQADPEVQKLIAESPAVAALVKEIFTDPAVKNAIVTFEKVAAVLSKPRG